MLHHISSAGEALFWAALGCLCYTYLGYPMLLAMIAAFRKSSPPEVGYCPSVTVLIPAYNEQVHIRRKIIETLALDYPRDCLEILIVSDGSTDRTDSIVQDFDDPRIRLIRVDRQKGKTHAQNEGV